MKRKRIGLTKEDAFDLDESKKTRLQEGEIFCLCSDCHSKKQIGNLVFDNVNSVTCQICPFQFKFPNNVLETFFLEDDTVCSTCNTKLMRSNYQSESNIFCFPCEMSKPRLLGQLKFIHSHETFRFVQREAITSLLNGRDCLVVMPTGGGKSLIYETFSHVEKGCVIVISPLISLIKDAMDRATRKGILSKGINSSTPYDESEEIMDSVCRGKVKMLFVTPEKIDLSHRFKRFLDKAVGEGNVSMFAIDEVHCISEYGHDFRVSYRKMNLLKEKYPNVPICGLTGTAPLKVQNDILQNLHLFQGVDVYVSNLNRANIFYEVKIKNKKQVHKHLHEWITEKNYKGKCGIVYCNSKKDCAEFCEQLKKKRHKAAIYHAGLSSTERTSSQNKWQQEKIHIMVATIAFGMGIDKKDVRFVVHTTLPHSFASYYQESGRAGRDGLQSHSLVFYAWHEKSRVVTTMSSDNLDPDAFLEKQEEVLEVVEGLEDICGCRRITILKAFDESYSNSETDICQGNCDNCQNNEGIETIYLDITELSRNLLKLVQEVGDNKKTMPVFVKIAFGSKAKDILKENFHKLKYYGCGKDFEIPNSYFLWSSEIITKVFKEMIFDKLLVEVFQDNTGSKWGKSYFKLSVGEKGKSFLKEIDGKYEIRYIENRFIKDCNPENDLKMEILSLRTRISRYCNVKEKEILTTYMIEKISREIPKTVNEFKLLRQIDDKANKGYNYNLQKYYIPPILYMTNK